MVWFILLQAREEKQGKQERQAKDNNGKARELVDVVVVAAVVCFDVVVIFVSSLFVYQNVFLLHYVRERKR